MGGGAMRRSAAAGFGARAESRSYRTKSGSGGCVSIRSTIDSGSVSRPAAVSQITLPFSRLADSATIRRPFLRITVSARTPIAEHTISTKAADTSPSMGCLGLRRDISRILAAAVPQPDEALACNAQNGYSRKISHKNKTGAPHGAPVLFAEIAGKLKASRG
jgi:hypothetical protein